MRRKQSHLFAPYRTMGVVCGPVQPAIFTNSSKNKMTSLMCPLSNVLVHYHATKLRVIASSDCLPADITAVAANSEYTYVAAGDYIYRTKFARDFDEKYRVDAIIKHMVLFGTNLVAVDVTNGIHVFDTESNVRVLHNEGSSAFEITSLCHPATYLNKVLLGSKSGSLRIFNVKTNKVVHEFTNAMDSGITVLEQTPAIDVIAIGLESGRIMLHNIRIDETVCTFKHDHAITAVGFRTDGEPFMSTADVVGHIAVWNLEKKELLGKIVDVHTGPVTKLHFLISEPIMISTSADNSIRTWVLDGADGMPRQLNILEGHSEPITDIKFANKHEVISSGADGSLRKYSVAIPTMRQKLGSVGVTSKKKASAKKQHRSIETLRWEPAEEMAFGWTREAAWDNIICRHKDSLVVTSWSTRKNKLGELKLVHERFTSDSALFHTTATSICISPCGNFAFVGYSSGHLDQFNVQSGRFIRSFIDNKYKEEGNKLSKKERIVEVKAHKAAITALSIDAIGNTLISGCASGQLKFWQVRNGSCDAIMRTKLKIHKSCQSPTSSLLAVSCKGERGEVDSVAVIDTLCRRVVRTFAEVGPSVSAMSFSSDGRWLLTADGGNHVRVWELTTSQLIDVLLFDKPCIGISFNPTGEFVATAHKDEKAIQVWANKTLFAAHISITSLPLNFIPSWDDEEAGVGVSTFVLDDSDSDSDSDSGMEMDEDVKPLGISTTLVQYSGLPPSRWANLPELSLIKERNKPKEAPRKPKQAPFFLSAAPTLDGFHFDIPQEETAEERKALQAKRSLLELESSFSSLLRSATSGPDLVKAFETLKMMSVSAIDFQIRSLAADMVPNFFSMLHEVLKTKTDFDLVQAYMAAAIKIHRSALWANDDGSDELTSILEQLSLEEEAVWNQFDDVLTDNAAVVQWVKNALL